MKPNRRFPAPWRVERTEGGHFVVKDATGFSICYVSAREDEALRSRTGIHPRGGYQFFERNPGRSTAYDDFCCRRCVRPSLRLATPPLPWRLLSRVRSPHSHDCHYRVSVVVCFILDGDNDHVIWIPRLLLCQDLGSNLIFSDSVRLRLAMLYGMYLSPTYFAVAALPMESA